MPLVRVRMLPEPIDVPDDEVEVLRSQGLLVEDKPADPEGAGNPPADPPAAKNGKES